MPTISIHPETGATRISNAPPRSTADDGMTTDERKFGTEFFVPGIYRRRGQFGFQNPPAVSRELLASVVKEAGTLFSAEDEKQIAAIAGQLKRADEQLCENAYNRVRMMLPEHFQAQIDAAIAQGKQPDPVPSFEERLAQTRHIRAALHKRKKELHAQAFATIKPAVLKFSKAAWTMLKEQDRTERGGLLERWRLTFSPSPALRALAYLALRSTDPLLWFEDCGTCAVSTDSAQIWGHLLAAQPAPLPKGITLAEIREQQRTQEDARRNREMDEEKREHERRLKEINRQNDSIRNQSPTAPPFRGGYSVPTKAAAAPTEPAPTATPEAGKS